METAAIPGEPVIRQNTPDSYNTKFQEMASQPSGLILPLNKDPHDPYLLHLRLRFKLWVSRFSTLELQSATSTPLCREGEGIASLTLEGNLLQVQIQESGKSALWAQCAS